MRALAMAGCCAAMFFAACGGSPSNFPDEVECPAPTPLPTSRANPGRVSPNGYVSELRNSAGRLEQLRATLRSKYPDDTFHQREEFRPDFADYASQTVCTAQAMFDIDPPDARFSDYDATLDTLLQDLIDFTRAGREAVKKRNVSEYRDWFDGVDAKISAVRQAANAAIR
ncbi:MAG: hypothetical protein AB7N24_16045 [Dehalococcoidia bacterium]